MCGDFFGIEDLSDIDFFCERFCDNCPAFKCTKDGECSCDICGLDISDENCLRYNKYKDIKTALINFNNNVNSILRAK